MKKKLSLLLAAMLVMSLVPMSSFAGTASPEADFTIEMNDTDSVTVDYKLAGDEANFATGETLKFAVSNDLTIKGIKVYEDRKEIGSSTSDSVELTAGTTENTVTFVLELEAKDEDAVEGEFTVSAKVIAPKERSLFSNKVVGKVIEAATNDVTVKRIGDIKNISRQEGKNLQVEINNVKENDVIKLTSDNSRVDISNVVYKSKGFVVALEGGKVPADVTKLTAEFDLTGNNKASLGEVSLLVTINRGSDVIDVETVVAEIVEYGATLKAVEKGKKEIATVVAGKETTVEVTLKGVTGSLAADRQIEFVLEDATLISVDAVKGTKVDVDTTDGEISFKPSSDEVKFNMKVKADADAEGGVATLTASGRDISEDLTVDVLNIEKAFEIDTKVTEIKRGESADTADIVITETVVGQVKAGNYIGIALNGKNTFNEKPEIEATNGMKFGKVKLNDAEDMMYVEVTARSTKLPAEITISGVAVDMLNSGIQGRNYKAELLVSSVAADKDGDFAEKTTTSYGEFNYTKCVAEYSKMNAKIVFTLGSANYTVDGVVMTLEAPVFTKDNRTMLPIGPLALALGLDVNYNADTQTATFRDSFTGQVVSVKENASVLYNNGIEYKMHTTAVTVNGRIFVPVASITDAFGAKILWDEATQTVTIN